MAMKGINARISVSTTEAGVYTVVAEVREGTINIGGENIDVAFFGTSVWTTRIQGRKDVTLSLSGYLVPGDTNGQVAIRSALINDTDVFVKYLWDGTNGFRAQYRVAAFNVNADVDGIVGLSIELEGTTPVTI